MAGAELSVLTRQRLAERIDSHVKVASEATARNDQRNVRQISVEWQFTIVAALT